MGRHINFKIPPGGLVVAGVILLGASSTIKIPIPQRCIAVSVGIARGEIVDVGSVLTFASERGDFGVLVLVPGILGAGGVSFFSLRDENSFGPGDSLTVTTDGLGLPDGLPIWLTLIMQPG